jgi:non-heme chloroperoxidase
MAHPSSTRFATARLGTGPRLHYAERGDKEGEAIVFLHAYADSWFSYGRVLHLLSPAYHALAPDQRGHGDSDKPECCYAADDFAADADAFMDAVGIEGATLAGDSSGGLIAQRAALDYPHRVSRLVLLGSPTTLVTNETVMEAGRISSRWKIPSLPSSSGSSRRARSTTPCRKSS